MHFYSLIEELVKNKKVRIYVDMDGVIASYDIGKPYDFDKKRPLTTNINLLRKISELDKIELFILSICKKNFQEKEKNDWLDIYAPFFKKENRIILSKERYPGITSKELKANYLKQLNCSEQLVLIDDDNQILFHVREQVSDIILFQDSELVD
ncbi:MAG: hypothetical protein E7168_03405 [Firmicutes bacterium]|nr:hypothetical protein [Bacillota bacterium]